MHNFDYHAPQSLDAALTMISDREDAKIIAGGMTLLPTLKQRLAAPSDLIDLAGIVDLRGVKKEGNEIVIGAMTCHHDVATSDIVKTNIPALAKLAGIIGDPAVRHRGTIGGSVANNDPAADYPSACLALNATIITNKRKIPADEFFVGLFETALEEGELIVKISFPIPSKAAYEKFRNPASRYAIVGVFVAKKGSEARVAVTGAGNGGVFRPNRLEAALTAKFHPKGLDGLSFPAEGLNTDIHADAEYRAHLIMVMTRRAVAKALAK